MGRLIYLDAATIKGVVDRLHLRGFVTALNDPKDRRRRAVALTDRGRQVTEAAMLVAAEITAATLAPLTADEQRADRKAAAQAGLSFSRNPVESPAERHGEVDFPSTFTNEFLPKK